MSFKIKLGTLFLFLGGCLFLHAEDAKKDPATGLVIDTNWELVRIHCIACHSTMAITSSMKNEKGWASTIKKMQAQHGLYPLGEMESKIVAYLADHYNIPDRPFNPKIRKPLED